MSCNFAAHRGTDITHPFGNLQTSLIWSQEGKCVTAHLECARPSQNELISVLHKICFFKFHVGPTVYVDIILRTHFTLEVSHCKERELAAKFFLLKKDFM